MSEELPQGKLACGSQAFIATLLFHPSMSGLRRKIQARPTASRPLGRSVVAGLYLSRHSSSSLLLPPFRPP